MKSILNILKDTLEIFIAILALCVYTLFPIVMILLFGFIIKLFLMEKILLGVLTIFGAILVLSLGIAIIEYFDRKK